MARVIRARDIDAILDGHPQSEWTDEGWLPGWRTAQDGRRQVNVFHDGSGEQDGLDKYRLELHAHGYHVVDDQMPGGGRRRLHITQP